MNKLRIVLVTFMVSILLSACGNSQTASSNQHGGDVIENENTAQLSDDEVAEENSAEKNNGIELLTRDSDKANFTPKTDDYVYAVKHKFEGEGNEYEVAILISFDENGKRVQWVERDINGEDTTYINLYEEYYVDTEPNSVRTDKFCVLTELAKGGLDSNAIDGDYYYSKELTSQQTAFDNLYSEGDFIDLSTFPHVTDDYILWQSNEKITVEGYVNTGRPRPGSRREVQGIIMYDNDYTVEEYGAFSYNEYSIECFDETGTEVGHIVFLQNEI